METLTETPQVADAIAVSDAVSVPLADFTPLPLERGNGATAPIKTNASQLEALGRVTEQVLGLRQTLITKIKNALADVRGLVLEKARKQAVVIGYVAELLSLKCTNKELALALTEPYDESYHGPKPLTVTLHSEESGMPPEANFPKSSPNPYAQAVRRYKLLAMIEAGIAADGWDLTKIAEGVIINSVRYTSPVAALTTGHVTMEAVFQAYMNILQPRVVNMENWSTSVVQEARMYAPKVRVTVRQFDKKMNREQKVSVFACKAPAVLYGLVTGLLDAAAKDSKVKLSRKFADQIIKSVESLTLIPEDTK